MPSFSLDKLPLSSVLQPHLNSRAAAFLCLALALLNKSLVAWLHTDLEGDKALYLLLSRSILEGHPPLEPLGFSASALVYNYNPAIASPLYTVLALPLLWLTRSYTDTSIIIDVLSWTVFLTAFYRFGMILLKERWGVNVMVLLCGFFLYPHELQSGPKDTLALGLILWCINLVHGFATGRASMVKSILLALLFVLLASVKFLYLPLVGLFMAVMMLVAWRRKSRAHLMHSLAVIGFCLAAGFAFYLYIQELREYILPAAPNPVQQLVSRISPQNLVHTYPFISSSLLNTNFWSVQIQDILGLSYNAMITIFQILDLLLIVVLVFFFRAVVKRLEKMSRFHFRLSLGVACFVVFMVMMMSLRYEPVVHGGAARPWSFVQDARSFLFPMLFLQATLFYYVFRHPSANRTLANFLLILFVIESLHGGYFTAKRLVGAKELKQSIAEKTAIKQITNFIAATEKQFGSSMVLATPDAHLRRYALLKELPVQYYSTAPCDSVLSHRSPILFVTYQSDSSTLPCHPGGVITRDTIPPFSLTLYESTLKD
jgi:hypothetical protein